MTNNIEIIYDNKESIIKSSEDLARHLFEQILCVGDAMYMLMDFEFYIKTKNSEVFKDDYVYGHEQQLKKGFLFSHDSRFDITWGNDELYVGILMRSLAKLYDKNTAHPNESFQKTYKIQKYIMGPHAVADEICNQFNVLQGCTIRFEEAHYQGMEGMIKLPHYTKTKRVGLPEKDFENAAYYRELPLRHVAFLPDEVMKRLLPKQNVKDIRNIIIKDFLDKDKSEQTTDLIKLLLNEIPSVLK